MSQAVLWTSEELRHATNGTLVSDVKISGVSIDTRTLQPGELFVALKGLQSDGHLHAAAALERGAAVVMVQETYTSSDPRCLRVSDTLDALVDLARYRRRAFGGKVIAITGSVGKTTTKELLRIALAPLGQTHAAVASYNNHWGVPLTLSRLPRNAAFCIAEIGMNHRAEIAPLAALVAPDLAIITTLGDSHIGTLGSLDAIAAEKAEIITALPPGAASIVRDVESTNPFLLHAARKSGTQLVSVGFGEEAMLPIRKFQQDAGRCTFEFVGQSLSLPSSGEHMASNAAMALAVPHILGYDLSLSAGAMAEFALAPGRGAVIPVLDGQAHLLDESYNASTLSMRAALKSLELYPAKRRIAILGDMREMGEFSSDVHDALLPDIVASADLVFCCCRYMQAVFDRLPHERRGSWAADATALAPIVCAALQPGDLALVKGSNGSKMNVIVSALKGWKAQN